MEAGMYPPAFDADELHRGPKGVPLRSDFLPPSPISVRLPVVIVGLVTIILTRPPRFY